jgi:nucleotide-binding universal stress UspA family protein
MVLACKRFGLIPTSGGGDGAVNPRSASNSVVVGIDGSRASINGRQTGVAEAVQRDVPLRLVHAVPAAQCTTIPAGRQPTAARTFPTVPPLADIGNPVCVPDGGHTPACAQVWIQLVGLESHDEGVGVGGQLGAAATQITT